MPGVGKKYCHISSEHRAQGYINLGDLFAAASGTAQRKAPPSRSNILRSTLLSLPVDGAEIVAVCGVYPGS